jgi:NAD(P)-dependent dehydrogenase (short-subunit alcohol dehydrogenase family)
MAQEGARVVVNDFAFDDGVSRAERVADEIKAQGGTAIARTEDVSTFTEAGKLVQAAVEAFGTIDILVNNAGRRAANEIGDVTEEDFEVVIGSHLRGTFGMIKHTVPIFIEKHHGVILNTGSESGLGHPFNSHYAAAKEGILGLTRSLARELGPEGIRINQIRPRANDTGSVETRKRLERYAAKEEVLGVFRLGRRGKRIPSTAAQVAKLSVWLCTDAAADANGRDFFVAGDQVAVFTEPAPVNTMFRDGGWNLDTLDAQAPNNLLAGMFNEFALKW